MSGNECYLPEFDSNVDRSTTINDVDLEPMDRGRMRSDLLEIVKCVCVWVEGRKQIPSNNDRMGSPSGEGGTRARLGPTER